MQSNRSIQTQINDLLDNLQDLAPRTHNRAVNHLKYFRMLINNGLLSVDDIDELNTSLSVGERLLGNLRLAKEAAEYAASKMIATNNPEATDAQQQQLTMTRLQLNKTQLQETCATLKKQRQRLDSGNTSQFEFTQSAYRKGSGFNMGMWYQYSSNKSRQPGNCGEQSNIAFVYLYTLVREAANQGRPSPIDRLDRIDVTNNIGGHCFILIDRTPHKNYRESPATIDLLQDNVMHDFTCVVSDPWNKKNPFYPLSDLPNFMPECGLRGVANVEFSLDFSGRDHEITPLKARL